MAAGELGDPAAPPVVVKADDLPLHADRVRRR
jgi:hypothetical protein